MRFGEIGMTTTKFEVTRFVTWFIACAIAMCSDSSIIADEATKQRFLQEYPASSKFIQDRMKHVRCEYETDLLPNVPEYKFRFFRSDGFEKVEFTRMYFPNDRIVDSPTAVLCLKGRPSFDINRDSQEAHFSSRKYGRPLTAQLIIDTMKLGNAKSILSEFSEIARDVTGETARGALQARYDQMTLPVYAIQGAMPEGLISLMKFDSFEVIDANPVAGKPGIVDVRFRTEEPYPLICEAHMDTNNHWAVTRIKFIEPSLKIAYLTIDVEYGEPQNGLSLPVQVKVDKSPPYRITRWSFEPTPSGEFRLSHYGLKDKWMDWFDPRTRLISAVITLSTGLLSIVLIVRKYKRRARKRSASRTQAIPNIEVENAIG
jgi:hypothetical protein